MFWRMDLKSKRSCCPHVFSFKKEGWQPVDFNRFAGTIPNATALAKISPAAS